MTKDKAENPRAVAGNNSVAGDQLKAFVERIEHVDDEISSLRIDVKEIYAEAKGNGFDTKTIRKVIALRKKSEDMRREEAAMLDLYCSALGIFA